MRRILPAAEYESVLRGLSSDEVRQAALAVVDAARVLMARHGLERVVFLCDGPLDRIGALSAELLEAPRYLSSRDDLPDFSCSLVCDLLFSLTDTSGREAWIKAVNECGCPVLSVGIPAGVDPDVGKVVLTAVNAQITVAPSGYLPGLFLNNGLDRCGQIWPIGGETTGEGLSRFEEADARRLLPPRKRTAHKGDSGKALLCVGSPRYVGAALLSARACLAAGCGILYVACPDEVRHALSRLPEAIGVPVGRDWNKENCQSAIQAMEGMKALGIGCGVGGGDISPLLGEALRSGIPLTLDADGLNCLARHPELFPLLHNKVVLTPHPGEMSRLTGVTTDRITSDPVSIARQHAGLWGCTVLLKGAATVVSDGQRTCIVAEGNSGLGKGGSGDALTGIITGLLAQGVVPYDAACLGSYMLGTSAEKAFELLKERMLRATNVVEALENWNE